MATTPQQQPLRKSPPKGFTKEASSPTLDGILKHISRYYGGEEKTLEPTEDPSVLRVYSKSGKMLSTLVIQTTRGYYFGYFS